MTWSIPGDNGVAGIVASADAVIERSKKIGTYGHTLNLTHILVSRDLATVCYLGAGKVASIETYMADIANMNAFFV
ncbi:MAG TPA: hypothetical protein VGN81_33435 [Pseudonocardiaceae bacterium]